MRYSLSHLRVFTTVADLGSLTEAAEKLGRTPSTVSMALKAFEEEVGVPLFETERKNRLSKTGVFIQSQARDVIAHYERATASMKAFARNQTGRVDLACVPSVAISILPDVLLNFRKRYPGVEIDVRDADSRSVVEAVETGKVGFGVASIRSAHPEIQFEPLFEDALGIVCRSDDPIVAGPSPIDWTAVRDRTFIGNGISGQIESPEISEIANGAPVVVYNVLSLLALVRAGLGITILPRLSIPASEKDVSFVPIHDTAARRSVGLITRSIERSTPATEAFMVELRTVLRKRAHELHISVPQSFVQSG